MKLLRGHHGFLAVLLSLDDRKHDGLAVPQQYMQLLGRLLPFNLNATSVSSTVGEVRVISVPADCYLSAEQIAKMNLAPAVIEHAPQFEPEPSPEFERIEDPAEAEIEAQPAEPTPTSRPAVR
jgi:hypothetical protein